MDDDDLDDLRAFDAGPVPGMTYGEVIGVVRKLAGQVREGRYASQADVATQLDHFADALQRRFRERLLELQATDPDDGAPPSP